MFFKNGDIIAFDGQKVGTGQACRAGADNRCRVGGTVCVFGGRKERALFVVDRLYQNLMVYLSHPDSPKHKGQPLFPVSDNKAIASSTVQKKIKRYCRDAGITERVTPHVLRHSFATEMYHEKVPVHAIQVMMGHEKAAETSLYIKVRDSFKKQALRQLTLSVRMSWE